MRILIDHCRVISGGKELASGSILMENGTIAAVAAAGTPRPAADRTVDASGLTAVPGFIDMHCHGRNNFDFCDADPDGVNLIARKKLEEGVTTLLPTTLTLPEKALTAALKSIAKYDGGGCRIPGVHLEGPFINPHCTGAQNPAYVRRPDLAEVRRLNDLYPVKKVSFAIEMEGAPELAAGLLKLGIVPSCVHSAATYAQFRAGYAAGLRNLSHFCNQMTPLHHREIGLVGAGLLHDDVYLELICDKMHIAPEMIALTFKVRGAGHIELISDAMRASGMPDGDYTLGGLPVVVSGGAARLKSNGALAGSTLRIDRAVKNVCEVTHLPLAEVVRSASEVPAVALGLKGFGRLEPGYAADLVLLDSDCGVVSTWVGGICRYMKQKS